MTQGEEPLGRHCIMRGIKRMLAPGIAGTAWWTCWLKTARITESRAQGNWWWTRGLRPRSTVLPVTSARPAFARPPPTPKSTATARSTRFAPPPRFATKPQTCATAPRRTWERTGKPRPATAWSRTRSAARWRTRRFITTPRWNPAAPGFIPATNPRCGWTTTPAASARRSARFRTATRPVEVLRAFRTRRFATPIRRTTRLCTAGTTANGGARFRPTTRPWWRILSATTTRTRTSPDIIRFTRRRKMISPRRRGR